MWMIDASVFIQWLKQGLSPARLLEPFIQADRVIACGITRVEVLRGIIKPEVKLELALLFDVIPEINMTAAVWQTGAETAWLLDRKGIILPLTDLIIGVCAIQAKAELVTLDQHFKQIPRLKTRKDLPGINALGRSD